MSNRISKRIVQDAHERTLHEVAGSTKRIGKESHKGMFQVSKFPSQTSRKTITKICREIVPRVANHFKSLQLTLPLL